MNPRPLHRWKSLWLGLFVTCFLAWAWWDSLNFGSEVVWQQAHVSSGNGGLMMRRETMYSMKPQWSRRRSKRTNGIQTPSLLEAPFFVRGGGLNTIDMNPAARPTTFRQFYIVGFRLFPRENWLLYIPYWLILPTFVVPWSAFLIWRSRNRIKLTP